MTSTASCRRLRALVAQVAPAPSADRSFAGSELDPVSGAQAGMTITDIKPWVPTTWPSHFTNHSEPTSSVQPSPTNHSLSHLFWHTDCAVVEQDAFVSVEVQVSNLAGAQEHHAGQG